MTGSPDERCSQNSLIPPSNRNSSSRSPPAGAGLVGHRRQALGAGDLGQGQPGAGQRRRDVVTGGPLVPDPDGEARHEVGGLPGPLRQRVEAPPGVAHEHLRVGPEPDPGAGHLLRHPAHLPQARAGREGCLRARPGELPRHPAAETGRPLVPLAVDAHVHPRRQGVHHRGPHPVQPARRGVRAAAELAAGVQPGHHQLDAGELGFRLHVNRDAPAVVPHLRRPVGVQDHLDEAAVAGQRLVHRVVEDLPQAVHEATAVGGADVHAGPLADRLQALQHRQVACRVGAGGVRRGCDRRPGGGGGFGSHGSSPPMGGGPGRPELFTGLDGRLAATAGLRGEPRRRIYPHYLGQCARYRGEAGGRDGKDNRSLLA